MIILNRYIANIIFWTTCVVVVLVMTLSFFISLLTELRDIGTGDYGFPQALIHVALGLPYIIYQFFPMLILIGGVLGLSILSTHHELMVMRASGVSLSKIIYSVVLAAMLLIFFMTFFGEAIAPPAKFLADKQKQSAQNSGQAVATHSGVWVHEGNNFLHVDQVIGPHHLEGVKRYEFDSDHRLLAAYQAESLDLEEGVWQVHNMEKTTFSKDRTKSRMYPKATWNLTLNASLLNVGIVEPSQLSLAKLTQHIQELKQNGLQANRFQFEFWKRIFQPLATLVMILLAVPFVIGAPRSVTMGWRIVFSVIIGFIFYMLNEFLGQMSVVFQLSPVIAAIFPTVVFALGWGIFMVKTNA